jgi:hypothetical protein
MKARELIHSASFAPDDLKVIARAFDEAWSGIAGNFDDDPSRVEVARLKLAKALLAVANANGQRDVETLKNAALQALALDYREKPDGGTRASDASREA